MNLELLEEVCQTPGAPGFEDRIRDVVIRELEPLVDELHVDNMGNVIARPAGVHHLTCPRGRPDLVRRVREIAGERLLGVVAS